MKILIAEDDVTSRRVLEMTLRGWGHEVVVTTNGEEAWAALTGGDAPPLAILDVLMPRLDGLEICRRLRALNHHTPAYIILLTAMNLRKDTIAGLDAGADDYLVKPFDAEELRARVQAGIRIVELQRNLAARVCELAEGERRYRHLVENSLGLICTHDLEGKLLSINFAAAESLGYTPEEMLGRSLRDFVAPSARHLFAAYLSHVGAGRSGGDLVHVVTKQGDKRVWLYRNRRYDEMDGTSYILGHAQDVTDLKRAEASLQNLSLTDELTKVYNRRGFMTLAEQSLKSARRGKHKDMLLFYADMDGLKRINDTFGHEEGSRALVNVADALRRTFRNADIVGRIGGDEFTVLAVDAPQDMVETILARLEYHLVKLSDPGKYRLSVSVGHVRVPADSDTTLDDLLDTADARMYAEKRKRREARP